MNMTLEYFLRIVLILILTKGSESTFTSLHEFAHCHIIVFVFNSSDTNTSDVVSNPLVILRSDELNQGVVVRAVRNLKLNFPYRKEVCQVLIGIQPEVREHMEFISINSAWLLKCDDWKRSHLDVCYIRQTYYIFIRRKATSLTFPFMPDLRVPIYGYLLQAFPPLFFYDDITTSTSINIRVEVRRPCGSGLVSVIPINFTGIQIRRSLLDALHQIILDTDCPILWRFYGRYKALYTSQNATSFQRFFHYPKGTVQSKKFEFPYKIFELCITSTSHESFVKTARVRRSEQLINFPITVMAEGVGPTWGSKLHRILRIDSYRFVGYKASYNFLTCDGNQKFIDFGIFSKPFDLHTWIMSYLNRPTCCPVNIYQT